MLKSAMNLQRRHVGEKSDLNRVDLSFSAAGYADDVNKPAESVLCIRRRQDLEVRGLLNDPEHCHKFPSTYSENRPLVRLFLSSRAGFGEGGPPAPASHGHHAIARGPALSAALAHHCCGRRRK